MDDTRCEYKSIWTLLLPTLLVVSTVAILVLATDYVLLIFLGILFGVFLNHTTTLLGNYVPVGYGWNLAIVTILLLSFLAGGLGLFGVRIESQLDQTSLKLDESAERLETWLNQRPIAMTVFEKIPFANQLLSKYAPDTKQQEQSASDKGEQETKGAANSSAGSGADDNTSVSSRVVKTAAGRVFSALRSITTTSLGLVANLGLVFFVGLFIAIDPALYRDGFARLFPIDRRNRVVEVMNGMGDAMFAWLIGRFASMLITGAGTAFALWLLGVPMPFAIGAMTALLTFIPNIGGIIALSLAVLMALTQGPMTVLWVVILYAILQLVESNVITPLIQQHQTSIPPALLVGFQVVMGAMTGFLGLLVATPLLAAGMVVINELWIKDTLGDEIETSQAAE